MLAGGPSWGPHWSLLASSSIMARQTRREVKQIFCAAIRDKSETILGAGTYKDVKCYQQHSTYLPSVYTAVTLPREGRGHTYVCLWRTTQTTALTNLVCFCCYETRHPSKGIRPHLGTLALGSALCSPFYELAKGKKSLLERQTRVEKLFSAP